MREYEWKKRVDNLCERKLTAIFFEMELRKQIWQQQQQQGEREDGIRSIRANKSDRDNNKNKRQTATADGRLDLGVDLGQESRLIEVWIN